MAIETARQMVLHCPLDPDVLLVRHLKGREKLGACFEYVLTLYSTSPNVQAEELLGQHASVAVRCGEQPWRFFDGIVCEFAHTGSAGRYWTYRMVLRPWLWLLSRNSNCRVFQRQTTLEIARSLFQGISSDLESQLLYELPSREYCVQYHESDLAFITRLFEDDGIYYYFKHQLGMHTLVIVDSASAHATVPGHENLNFRQRVSTETEEPCAIYTWHSRKSILPGAVVLGEYDYKKPRADMHAGSANPQDHPHANAEVYDYPGEYTEVAVGEDRVRLRMEAITADYDVSEGTTDAAGLGPGTRFTLRNHPREVENRAYLITEMSYDADSGTFESGSAALRFEARLRAMPADVPFRPHGGAPRPVISGAQTATVVGPKNSEIWTDDFGRVKVQFHWDRLGKRDESSSCWLRVAQQWASSGWGSQHIPRVGQEVVIQFLDGNPDHPLVTGSVYNDINRPPFKLPQHQTQSGWKTSSTPNGNRDDYNELRFDDKKGAEQVHLQAQRDLSMHIKRDSSVHVGGDSKRHVAKNDRIEIAEGGRYITVNKGELRSEVAELYAVKAKTVEHVASDSIVFQVGEVTLKIDGQSIALKVGEQTRLKLDMASLLLLGPVININPPSVPPEPPVVLSCTAKPDSGESEEALQSIEAAPADGPRNYSGDFS